MSNLLSYATRAAFSAASLPEHMDAIVIERFETTSALCEAVYLCCGDREPDHSLKARNGDSWWSIHPDHLSLEAAGASGDAAADCSQAMDRVLGYLMATREARLRLGARDYVLANPVHLVQRAGDPVLSLAIEGSGRGISRLLVPQSSAERCALALSFASDASEVLASDFSVIVLGESGAHARCGTALLARFERTGDAKGGHRSAVLSNLDAFGEGAAFESAFDLAGAANPLVRDCAFASDAPSGTERKSVGSYSNSARLPEEVLA